MSPRGFCAGVDRAIEIVKKSIDKYGAPVYVRHEIVHNTQVVKNKTIVGHTIFELIVTCVKGCTYIYLTLKYV